MAGPFSEEISATTTEKAAPNRDKLLGREGTESLDQGPRLCGDRGHVAFIIGNKRLGDDVIPIDILLLSSLLHRA